jgi:hypothetical protein
MFPVRYGQTYRVELSFKRKTGRWIMSKIMIIVLINHRQKPIDSWARGGDMFPVRYGQTYRDKLSFK